MEFLTNLFTRMFKPQIDVMPMAFRGKEYWNVHVNGRLNCTCFNLLAAHDTAIQIKGFYPLQKAHDRYLQHNKGFAV